MNPHYAPRWSRRRMPDPALMPRKIPNCPQCGSPRVSAVSLAQLKTPGTISKRLREHGGVLQGCLDCHALWEPLPPGEPRHPEEPFMSFAEPCDNCAFRSGSPEVEDKTKWKKLLSHLKHGGRFYCHKGVPIGGEDGFQYPRNDDGVHDERNMRLCRGFLNAWSKWEGL